MPRLLPVNWINFYAAIMITRSGKRVAQAISLKSSSWHGQSLSLKLRSISSRTGITMMPEGPEVRTLVDQLQGAVGMRLCDVSFLSGRYVRHGRPDGFAGFCETMTPVSAGAYGEPVQQVDVIREWGAKGKFIYIVLDNGADFKFSDNSDFQRSIWITLGMSGRFVSERDHVKDSRHARWFMELFDYKTNEMKKIFYHDARNFGTLKFCVSAKSLAEKLDKLGPDILESNTTDHEFLDIFAQQNRSTNVCKFLMNQAKVSGIGNYILSEGLYRAMIDPFASLDEINVDQQRKLFHALQSTALQSYRAQGLTRNGGTFRDTEGNRGRFELELECYGRETASNGQSVRKEAKGPHGRAIWYVEDQLFVPRILRSGVSQEDADMDIQSADKSPIIGQVEAMTAHLHDQSWKEALGDAFQSESFENLVSFLEHERANRVSILPPPEDTFAALNLCPLDNVNVVIVGQDPYHGLGQAHGLAFSVKNGVRPPPSLRNIIKEAVSDVGIPAPPHGNLDCWARQGVLLLNTVFTVRQGEANSHSKQGWEEFTDTIIKTINDQREGVVFLLWGNPAAKKAKGVDTSKHFIIRSSHPSPLGAYKTSSPFFGSRCFSRANTILQGQGKEMIDWVIR